MWTSQVWSRKNSMTPTAWRCSSSLALRGKTLGKENHNYGSCHLLEARKNTKTAFSTAHHGCICQVGSSPVLFSVWFQAGDNSGSYLGNTDHGQTFQQRILLTAQARAPSPSQDRFFPVHCSELGYSLKKDKLFPGSNWAAAGELKITGMKQIWIYSGTGIKDVTGTERGLLLLLCVTQVSLAVFSTRETHLWVVYNPFHTHFWKHRVPRPGPGCNPVHLHWQFNHLALICHKWALTAANDALIDCSEWNNWQWLKVRLTRPRWNISRTIQVFSFHTSCTINYFEGDSYELTMESKNIIVFHYYANYAKKSSKIKSYWWYTALSSFSSDNSHLQPTEARLLSIPLLTSFTFQGGSCGFFLEQLFWHTVLRHCGI